MVTHDSDIASRVRRSLHVADGEIVEERINHLEHELAGDLAEERD
jgi:ABC-type lipoprotein export system ATPase subunit